jgi:AraC family transcriptional regulator
MLMNSLPTNVGSYSRSNRTFSTPGRVLPAIHGSDVERRQPRISQEVRLLTTRQTADAIDDAVQIIPCEAVTRRALTWDGTTAEIVQITTHQPIELRYRGPRHLLVLYQQGMRRDGDSQVEGLPRSSLRDLKGKLTFVPAGHEYRERHVPRALVRAVYIYFKPDRLPVHTESGVAADFAGLAPRLFFDDPALASTARKIERLLESTGSSNQPYFEALGVVLAHELIRLNTGTERADAPFRGGLAPWQQRIVTAHIEEHLAEPISLATLAQLVRLSPYYFCRAFKQSFGLPPHRYHTQRRIEQAKILLGKPRPSVTEIGLSVGYSETSSFTTAFRKATGITPTAYHRSLS